ncbi:hypothetical protein FOL47_005361 [Perkinsus chesapeaki]|uniref:Glycosyltransferase 61 catalytic domain-containing protein n=1 Tax=Perkinsus chesapeaki TaxID=330153 RepID=A0A7J6N2F6_PERCH|nr:hypothetical protein FOL47_005361 [Perkinsus chesapeaki]
MRFIVYVLEVIFCALSAAVAQDSRYEQLCERMLSLAEKADKAAARSDFQKAMRHLKKVRGLYAEAIELEPDEPQAHLTMANLELNANYMDNSLKAWEAASRAVDASEGRSISSERATELREQIAGRQRKTLIGKVSMERDRVYRKGQGNISKSIELAKRQVELVPNHPLNLHDLGTMYMMRSEVDPSGAWTLAVEAFRKAQAAAIELASPVLGCTTEGRLEDIAAEGRLELANVELIGGDAVMLQKSDCVFTVLSAHLYLNLGDNLPYPDPARETPPPPLQGRPRVFEGKVFVTVGYRSTMFYHFLLESLPRIVALQEEIRAAAKPKILLPWAGFVDGFTDILLEGLGIGNAEKVYYPTEGGRHVRAKVSEAVTYTWPARIDAKYDLPLHCVTPDPLLRRLREAMTRGVGERPGETIVVWLVRKASRDESRILKNERQLIAALQRVEGITIKEFDGAEQRPREAVELFSRAAVVVGVHGAGLSNILFCRKGTAVIELGFATPLSWHYMYLAEALGLRYERVLVDGAGEDDRAMGRKRLLVNVEMVVEAVRRVLKGGGVGVHDEM